MHAIIIIIIIIIILYLRYLPSQLIKLPISLLLHHYATCMDNKDVCGTMGI